MWVKYSQMWVMLGGGRWGQKTRLVTYGGLRFSRSGLSTSPLGIISCLRIRQRSSRHDRGRKMLPSAPPHQASEPASSVTWRANPRHPSWLSSRVLNFLCVFVGLQTGTKKQAPWARGRKAQLPDSPQLPPPQDDGGYFMKAKR